ncbi:hypothetical protein B9T27_08105 [Acinetobacter sp. ANC 4648]|nr:hypothetical protein B9T27_08105 [Acinetobacter sp. ANC 4648]
MNPTGGNSKPDYPYYFTTKPVIVKKIAVPIGTKLEYEEQYFKSGQQNSLLNEKKLISISFPKNQSMNWAGVPIGSINKYFNSEMKGFSVYARFKQLTSDKQTRFSRLWQECDDNLGISVKNTDDWSFNLNNINNIDSCSVNYQRYFKNNLPQQDYLDQLYQEMQKAGKVK